MPFSKIFLQTIQPPTSNAISTFLFPVTAPVELSHRKLLLFVMEHMWHLPNVQNLQISVWQDLIVKPILSDTGSTGLYVNFRVSTYVFVCLFLSWPFRGVIVFQWGYQETGFNVQVIWRIKQNHELWRQKVVWKWSLFVWFLL